MVVHAIAVKIADVGIKDQAEHLIERIGSLGIHIFPEVGHSIHAPELVLAAGQRKVGTVGSSGVREFNELCGR